MAKIGKRKPFKRLERLWIWTLWLCFFAKSFAKWDIYCKLLKLWTTECSWLPQLEVGLVIRNEAAQWKRQLPWRLGQVDIFQSTAIFVLKKHISFLSIMLASHTFPFAARKWWLKYMVTYSLGSILTQVSKRKRDDQNKVKDWVTYIESKKENLWWVR